ncbi:MAG: hypothetical protein M5U26_00325 [Planctomycetota bacterium]|nr:hypothetical protein [Planctomycetota bacterium]
MPPRSPEEVVYVKEFMRRFNGKWKAEMTAEAVRHTRVEVGTVTLLVTLNRNGTLKDVVVDKVTSGISTESIAICKRAVKLASPHRPFPSAMADRESWSFRLNLLYR